MKARESVNTTEPRTSNAAGQILVIFAIGIFALIAMVALVVEGGNAFAQQRIAQNGADAAANAGAVVVAEKLSGMPRVGADVAAAVTASIGENALAAANAEYTDDFGTPIGQPVVSTGDIPPNARGVRVGGNRVADTTFGKVIGFNTLTASAEATVVAGALSLQCAAEEDGCSLLPVTFPVQVFQCDSGGNLLEGPWVGAPPPGNEGDDYWPIVGSEDLPSSADPDGNPATEAILPLCRGSGESSGTFGWLDLMPGMNLAEEIEGPLTATFDLPDWFQSQTGNPNSVDDELSFWIHKPVLIPLHNGACRQDPGDTAVCPSGQQGVDPVGNNTWYYVHTLAVFYPHEILVQGSNVDQCGSAPGSPVVPVTNGGGFLGCMKGWFTSYVTAGPIVPGGVITPGVTPIGIQLIK